MRHIAFLLYPGCLALDIVGPMEVFHLANLTWAREKGGMLPHYNIQTYGTSKEPLSFSSGLRVLPNGGLGDISFSDIHTLIVPGGWWPDSQTDEVDDICRLLSLHQEKVSRLASVCTGSFFLAKSGVLDGRRATTHWAYCDRLREHFPNVEVEPNAMFIKDEHVYTAAGVTAGIDLALAMVEEDLGAHVAQMVARYMVLFLRRQGGQSQFSTFTRSMSVVHAPIREVQSWIAEHLDGDLRVEVLAKVANMSVRHFARMFKESIGMSPARFVERTRIEAARVLLEQTDEKLSQIATRCGFSSDEVMRRAFVRWLGVPPRDIRARFQAPRGESD